MWVARHACEEGKVSARATCKRAHLGGAEERARRGALGVQVEPLQHTAHDHGRGLAMYLKLWEVRMSASQSFADIDVSDERRHLHAAEERRRQGTG